MSSTKAKSIINTNLYMTLGTVSQKKLPWVTPVFYAYDGSNFYWYSRKEAEHSQNIALESKVSAVIYSVVQDDIQALYMIGQVVELSGEKLREGMACKKSFPE